MRRTLIALLLVAGLLLLAGCGNKGPLVRPPAQPVSGAPAPATSTAPPVPEASTDGSPSAAMDATGSMR